MLKTASLGFSRLGDNLELIKGLQGFLSGKSTEQELYKICSDIRQNNIIKHQNSKIDIIPSNDFSLYDHVWDTSTLLGNIPMRYYWEGGEVPLDIYLAPCIGHRKGKFEVPGMECRPWFNTQYYYYVPEFHEFTNFIQSDNKPIRHYIEARQFGVDTRPVLLGPISYIMLGKVHVSEESDGDDFDKFKCLDEIVAVYQTVLTNFKRIGVKMVQIDEPCLSTDVSTKESEYYKKTYEKIRSFASDIHITLTTGFGHLGVNADLVMHLPVDCIHFDLSYKPEVVFDYLSKNSNLKEISLGIVNGRNVFINNIEKSVELVEKVAEKVENVQIAASCSFLHCPVDKVSESRLDSLGLGKYLAFGVQKLDELNLIKRCAMGDNEAKKIAKEISKNHASLVENFNSINPIKIGKYSRASQEKRREKQAKLLGVPVFPITGLGRLAFPGDSGKSLENKDTLSALIKSSVAKQEKYGFNVISTGEYDRNSTNFDYFVDKVFESGIVNTEHGWIQTNFMDVEKPPIIFGELKLKDDASKFDEILNSFCVAQKMTKKPVKFRVFGPLTAMMRSFSDFQTPEHWHAITSQMSECCKIIIKEAIDRGCKVIQIDEYNILESMPLKISDFTPKLCGLADYIKHCYSGVADEVQIQMHISHSNLPVYIDDLDHLDLDLLLIEASRSNFDVLKDFSGYKYQGCVGIGVLDAKSLYTPSVKEIYHSIKSAIRVFDIEKIWLTHDSIFSQPMDNLIQSLENIHEVAEKLRERFG